MYPLARLATRRFLLLLLGLWAVSMFAFWVLWDAQNITANSLDDFGSAFAGGRPQGYFVTLLSAYFEWWLNFLTGDWGFSYHYQQSVSHIVGTHFLNSLLLFASGALGMIIMTLLVGALCAFYQKSWFDRLMMPMGSLLNKASMLLILVGLALLTTQGNIVSNQQILTDDGFDLGMLALPIISMILFGFGMIIYPIRKNIEQMMQSEYVEMHAMKGLSFADIILKYLLNKILLRIIIIMLRGFAELFSALLLVEIWFNYQGLGALLLQSALVMDKQVLIACLMLVSMMILLCKYLAIMIGYCSNPIKFVKKDDGKAHETSLLRQVWQIKE